MFSVGAFAIILDDQQRVLLCHRRDMDRWNLPGGGVISGETPWQAKVDPNVKTGRGTVLRATLLLFASNVNHDE
jgi:8-oxo-dGTP pyrophosphatase MutT (NUDIX family)